NAVPQLIRADVERKRSDRAGIIGDLGDAERLVEESFRRFDGEDFGVAPNVDAGRPLPDRGVLAELRLQLDGDGVERLGRQLVVRDKRAAHRQRRLRRPDVDDKFQIDHAGQDHGRSREPNNGSLHDGFYRSEHQRRTSRHTGWRLRRYRYCRDALPQVSGVRVALNLASVRGFSTGSRAVAATSPTTSLGKSLLRSASVSCAWPIASQTRRSSGVPN